MKSNARTARSGRHFLQIPGPTNVPDRVLQAIAAPTIDHRGPEFAALGKEVIAGMKRVFQTGETVIIYPSSGTGAWEAALSNTLSPGDRVLMFETGQFASTLAGDGRAARARHRFCAGRLAARSRSGSGRGKVIRRSRASDQSRLRRPQRNLDRRDQPHTRDPRGDRPGAPSGPVHGRHDLVIGFDRVSPRRVEGRRHASAGRRKG